jgi:hypothetical protein
MSGQRWTLAAVTYHWADAYLITYTRDRWVALRRDTRKFLSGRTLDELEATIRADYGCQPVPREFDPPDSREQVSWPPIPFLPGPDDCDGEEDATELGPDARGLPHEESLSLLLLLRRTFPQWDISYAAAARAWIARRRTQTICENSPALLAIALILIERQAGGLVLSAYSAEHGR